MSKRDIVEIKTTDFSEEGRDYLYNLPKGSNWPVVYIMRNNKKAYVGETTSIHRRMSEHLSTKSIWNLKEIDVIFDDEFNKSAVLDIEQTLIRLFNSDNKYEMLNLNLGQSSNHDYYQREKYNNKVEIIWEKLINRKIAKTPLKILQNEKLFKYSPYISLTDEQLEVAFNILNSLIDGLIEGSNKTEIVNGSSGTGKTVLAINLIYTLVSLQKDNIDFLDLDFSELTYEQQVMRKIKEYYRKNGEIKIAFVVPMSSLRKTLKNVFSKTKSGLQSTMVIGPSQLKNEKYDILFVDESHRLTIRKNIANMGNFDDVSRELGFNPEDTSQLDWIIKQSKTRVLFYDALQTIKGSDIPKNLFKSTINSTEVNQYYLKSQLRTQAGSDYIDYVKKLLTCRLNEKTNFNDNKYEFFFYDNMEKMFNDIKEKNNEHGLSRVVAGYSWEWISQKVKPKTIENIIKNNKEDIEIQGKKYIWNLSNIEYTIREDSINEIGSIHTTQGYDLNYVGVVFGREINYDKEKNEIIIDLNYFFDTNVKRSTDIEQVKEYIINSYYVMMTRGIKGCYVFTYHKELGEYFKKFIKKEQGSV